MRVRRRGREKSTPGRLHLLPLLVPVLLGILLMHGGLSAHAGHTDSGTHGLPAARSESMTMPDATMPDGGMNPRSAPVHLAGLDPRTRVTMPATDAGHDGHAGQLCLAFLRLAGVLFIALLLTRAVRSTFTARSRLRVASSRPGRSPPGGPPPSHAPSLVCLCVLRL
ncbi:hypothetical protein ThrDRAFT_03008 [Frankia casuarinae]|uniref:Uncharacterized protein n=1 Tax=Frankia casuarinae (strain DSM 45818 / CECT 9043 / HFP020203 / CcI3) TaxID=106370 RepID=Q2JCK5_FRACC|nr:MULTISPECIES: hypothetical protein [Frankia]TFE30441.1 hypothetical protein E0F15_11350 [Frankia sp. B2]ABD10987.1 hypothetical protein Francci3_1611 [Frankia casuarinae]EYT91391.1 hypothetical protein ThrDRAFT_03008 [Frankia casuarinae]KDA42843.1 hypothetical protein BMG523Draft_02232 [Frankia sp. BMG5.23]KEZ37495.1 hypothetical protein CEDDRAFT_01122 [Frankia sp. CeD]